MFSTLGRWVSRAFRGLWDNRFMSVAAICIVTAGLLLLGTAVIVGIDVGAVAEQLEARCEINVYLSRDVTEEETAQIEQALRQIEGVKSVSFYSKDARLQAYKDSVYQGHEDALQDLEADNPLRDSYAVTLHDIGATQQFVTLAEAIRGVEEVVSPSEVIQKLVDMTKALRTTGVVLVVFLAVIAMLIIANTIKLGMFARRQEIHIMKFVGATNGFIVGPFVIEGILLGVIGAFLASCLLLWGYAAVLPSIAAFISPMMLPDAWHVAPAILIGFLGLGAGIGLLGSLASIQKHFRV